MAGIALIGFSRNQDRGLDFTWPYIYFTCLYVKIPDWKHAHALRPCQLDPCVPRKQSGRRVRRSHAITCIPTDRTDVSDLGAAYHVHCFAKHTYILLNERIFRDMGEARQRADPDSSVLVHRHAAQFV